MTKPTPRPGLTDITLYTPGKSNLGDGSVHKLSSNESAMGASPAAVAAYQDAMLDMARYPDADATVLRNAIGKVHGIDPSNLIIGAGSDEIIQILMRAYCGTGDVVMQTAHAFSYYQIAARAAGAGIIKVPERELTADVDALLAAVTPSTRLLFLANPNNPTGTVLMANEVRRLRAGLRDDIMLVLDGAYSEYMTNAAYADGKALVDDAIASGADNVVMMRTFSKIYGLGGLRVGWGYGSLGIVEIFHKLRGPFNVNSIALAAATAAVMDREFVARNRLYNDEERSRVSAEIDNLGYKVTPSYGNFVLFEMPGAEEEKAAMAKALLAHLEGMRVLVRSAASSGLPGHVRVSIGAPEAMAAFLEALAQFRP